jgi:hypothetical protein
LFYPKENNDNSLGNIVPQDFDGVKGRHMDIRLGKGYDLETYGLYTVYVN